MDKYKIHHLDESNWMLVCPNGRIYFEWSLSDAIIRMDLHEGMEQLKRAN